MVHLLRRGTLLHLRRPVVALFPAAIPLVEQRRLMRALRCSAATHYDVRWRSAPAHALRRDRIAARLAAFMVIFPRLASTPRLHDEWVIAALLVVHRRLLRGWRRTTERRVARRPCRRRRRLFPEALRGMRDAGRWLRGAVCARRVQRWLRRTVLNVVIAVSRAPIFAIPMIIEWWATVSPCRLLFRRLAAVIHKRRTMRRYRTRLRGTAGLPALMRVSLEAGRSRTAGVHSGRDRSRVRALTTEVWVLVMWVSTIANIFGRSWWRKRVLQEQALMTTRATSAVSRRRVITSSVMRRPVNLHRGKRRM